MGLHWHIDTDIIPSDLEIIPMNRMSFDAFVTDYEAYMAGNGFLRCFRVVLHPESISKLI